MQANLPIVSIIVPVFNRQNTIEKCILSVTTQKSDKIELVLIDGGSKDGTVEIIKKFNDQIDYWVSEPDLGIYDAINKGLKLVKGRWVLVLGSDDYLLPNIVNDLVSMLENENNAYYGNVLMKSSQKIFNGKFSKYQLMYKNISHQSIFYPRKFYSKNNYNVDYKIAADYVYLLNYIKRNYTHLVYIPITIACYDDEGGVSSQREDQKFLLDRHLIIKDSFEFYYWWMYFIRRALVSALASLGIKNSIKRLLGK